MRPQTCGEAAFQKLRANESALKMPADRRDCKAHFLSKLGEWAFSLERLTDSFRLHSQGPFPKRIPKVSFGRPLLNAVLSRKVVPAPARGASLLQQKTHAGAPAASLR
ncbi:MAG: hypothetical protein E7569_01775 [Ruminococcaceae bacterium]|nr:hypothetical protein [Oscillospiraceae bacterium]